MKNRIISVLLLLSVLGTVVYAQTGPRFEKINRQENDNVMSLSTVYAFEVWHDKESGQEFICAFGNTSYGAKMSCWPTGRNWK